MPQSRAFLVWHGAPLCHPSGFCSLSPPGDPGFAPGPTILGPAGAMGSMQLPEEPEVERAVIVPEYSRSTHGVPVQLIERDY
jgi:hypothetical protein